jgi:hypothetical protein
MEALGGVTQLVLDGAAGIGVSGPLPGDAGVAGVEQIGVGNVVLISVAAPDHPLASPRTWRFADLGSKHMLLKEGIGWGNMPAHHG